MSLLPKTDTGTPITPEEFEAAMVKPLPKRLAALTRMRGRAGLSPKALDEVITATRAEMAGRPDYFELGAAYELGPQRFGATLVKKDTENKLVTFFYGVKP